MGSRSLTYLITVTLLLIQKTLLHSQINNNVYTKLESRLEILAESTIPELNNNVELSVSGASLGEFLRALARISNLNVNISPNIEGTVSNNFKNETALHIIIFICRQYQLDVDIVGTILSFSQIEKDVQKPERKYNIEYSEYNDLLSVDIREDTLFNVLKDIVKKSNKNVIASPEARGCIISCFVRKQIFRDALESIALANNLILSTNNDQSFLFDAGQEKTDRIPVSSSAARSDVFPRDAKNIRNQIGNSIAVTNNEGLYFVTANFRSMPITEVLKSLSSQSGLDYAFINEPEELVSLQIHNMEHDEFLRILLNASPYTFKRKNEIYLIGKAEEQGLRTFELIQLKYRSIKGIGDFIPGDIKNGLQISEFPELNALLVSGSEWKIEEVENFLRTIDRLVPLVQIELIVVDVRKGRDINTGITAGISDSISSGGTLLPGIDFTLSSKSVNSALEALERRNIVNLGRVNPNFYTNLKAMEQNNNIRIRSTPRLSTLNGHEATLTIGKTEYYLEQTQNVQGANNLITTITPQYREISADLFIQIIPNVSADEHVTLDIEAEFSDFTPAFVPNGPPGKSSRKFNSIIRLRNNEMIVLGGLEEESKSKSNRGIPILARIPVLNWIFSARNNSRNESRLLVFIRPTLMY